MSRRLAGSARHHATAVVAAVAVALIASGMAAAASPPPSAPAVESAPASLTGLTPQLPDSVIAASAAPGSTWRPEKAVYGSASTNDIAIPGAGGTTIRVNEIYPTLANGKPAPGKFPVLLTMTPYGKGQGGSSAPGSAQTSSGGAVTGGADNYLVQRGYIEVVEDVRGTGDSGGSFGLFDPVQTQDAIKVLDWAAHLPNSTGKVGTYGPSYLGIDQLLLAGAVGPNSPLKATFPMVPANDIYRDTSFMGGLLDFEFDMTYLGLTTAMNQVNPVSDATTDSGLLGDLAQVEADHATSASSYVGSLTAGILGGGDPAYDQAYWLARAPQTYLAQVAANHIPAYIVGGEFDIFQRGEPTDYAALQNAWAGRSPTAPMRPGQRPTGRYQLLIGPWEHINGSSVNVDPLELEWFDTWLKDEHTGMAATPTPVHYYDLGNGRFTETTTYPFTGATPTRLYLGQGALSASPPKGAGGADTLVWSPVGSPCGRPIDQWAMGGISIPTNSAGILAPCANDDSPSHTGPWTTSYTSAPFTRAQTLAGPISATIYASATTSQTELVAEVEEVTPDGSSYPLTEGALLGSQRQLDPSRTWTLGGLPLLPYHPYSQAAAAPVTPGATTRYDIEVFPTLATIAPGDRLRLTLATTDTPHLSPVPPDLPKLAGGVYAVQRSAAAPSALNLDLIGPPTARTPASRPGCPSPTGRLSGHRLGPISLGEVRAQVRRGLRRIHDRRAPYTDVFCFIPVGIRVGFPPPAVTGRLAARSRQATLGRVALVLTANAYYSLGGVRPGSTVAAARRRLKLAPPIRAGRNTWYLTASPGRSGVLKTRRGRVLEVGIADARFTHPRTLARRLLQSF